MSGPKVRELARKRPEAFESVARKSDDRLKEHLLKVLKEETSDE